MLEAANDLTQRMYDDFIFDSKATDISTPVSHVLRKRRGVCQDFAHLAITCLRALGLPARYVSGYLLTYSAARRGEAAGRGRLARLALRVDAGGRLGRFRSDQWRDPD